MSTELETVAARFAAWSASGDRDVLWPQVSPRARATAHRCIRRATQDALGVAGPRPAPRLECDDPAALGVAAFASGMGPLLGYWVSEGVIQADPDSAAVLRRQFRISCERAALMRRHLDEVLGRFADRAIAATLLKGAHTAGRYFPHVATRPAADIDILVHPAQESAAREALSAAGFLEARRTGHPVRSEWIHRHSPRQVRSLEVEHPDNPWLIDLHTGLERCYFRGRTVAFGRLAFECTEPIAGRRPSVYALAEPLLSAFLAVHATYLIRDVRLLPILELVLVVRESTRVGTLRWEALWNLLDATASARFAYPGFELAERLAPGTIDHDFLAALRECGTKRMTRVIDQVDAAGVALLGARSFDDRLIWARGAIDHLLILTELLWASDDAATWAAQLQIYRRRLRLLLGRRIAWQARTRDRKDK